MNIIIDECPNPVIYTIHLDEPSERYIGPISKVKGVEDVSNILGKYQLHIELGKAFDHELVLLEIQAEIMKHSQP